ncbi:hypothetical protein ACFXKD_26065 [Nocardiopsis aegyptia]|uniref:hypothetical protein n=1 Tax=Nocardiopsis aegyptia TaxID=220378 RepID=UPI00366F9065
MAKQPRDYLRWDLLDRGEDPVPWSVSDVRSLKTFYEKLSDAAEQAATDMRRLEGDKLGEGDTVSALKELVNELPKHLDKAHDAYEKGYKALDTWSAALTTARIESASVARDAATAYLALEDSDAWKEEVDGDDPARDEYISKLNTVLSAMDEAADTCRDALEEAKQGNPRELWGWLDAVVTWVEENPLIYAAIMVVGGLAAIFIPGLGIALALAALSISAAGLHREGKLGFNRESLFTLGMDALALVPGGALLRGGRAVSRAVGTAATRVPGRVRGGVSSAAAAVRANRGVQRVSSVAGTARRGVNRFRTHTAGEIAYSVVRDSATSMGSSITVQVAGEGKSFGDIDYGHEALTALGTSTAGASAQVLKDRGIGPFGGGSDGGSGGGGDPVPELDGIGSGDGPDSSGPPDTSDAPDPTGSSDNSGPPDTSGAPEGAPEPSGAPDLTPEFSDPPSTAEPGAGPQGSTTPEFSDASSQSPGGGGPQGSTTPEFSSPQTTAEPTAGPQGSTTPEFSSPPSTAEPTAGPQGSTTPEFSSPPSTAEPTAGPQGSTTPEFSHPTTTAEPSAGGPQGSTTPEFSDAAGPSTTSASPDLTPEFSDASTQSPGTGGPQGSTTPEFSDAPTTSEPSAGGPQGSTTPEFSDGPRGDRDDAPRDEFAPVSGSRPAMNAPPLPNRPLNQPMDPDLGGPTPDQRGGPSPEDNAPRPRGGDTDTTTNTTTPHHGGAPSPSPTPDGAAPAPRADAAPAPADTPSPDTPRPDNTRDDDSAVRSTPATPETRGEYRTTDRPDGGQDVSYRYPGRGGRPDFNVNVTGEGTNVNGTDVRADGNSMQVTGTDGSSATTSRQDGVQLTGPGGTRGASYRDGEVTVPTRGGDVSASRDTNGITVRTDDGLTVRQDHRTDTTEITHSGGGPIDQRLNGGGPDVTRPAADGSDRVPRAHVDDPGTGRTAEVGPDGYRVDVEGGGSHGYDRDTGTARVDSDGTRAEIGPEFARVSDAERGVDIRLRQDGVGVAEAGNSRAVIGEDGTVDVRTSNPPLSPDAPPTPHATQDASGHVRIGNTDTWPGQVRTEDGTGVRVTGTGNDARIHVRDDHGSTRTYDMHGTPVPRDAHPPLRLDPVTHQPSLVSGGTRVTLEPEVRDYGGDTVRPPGLRVETPQGWSVSTSSDEVTMRTPDDGNGSLEINRRKGGATTVRSGEHRVDASGNALRVAGPGGIRGESGADHSSVSDGSARTDVDHGDPSAGPVARTTSETDPDQRIAQSSDADSSVSTGPRSEVWARGEDVHTTLPTDGDRVTLDSGDRTVDVGPDGISARGPASDGGGWRASVDSDGRISGSLNDDHRIDVHPSGEGGRGGNPLRSPDDVEFRTGGDVEGTQRRSGRSEIDDTGNGTRVRDARGGARVDVPSDRNPLDPRRHFESSVRVTPDHVRISAPDGSQQRVDIPGARGGEPASPARPDHGAPTPRHDDGSPAPRQDDGSPAPRQDGETAVRADDGADQSGPTRDDGAASSDSPAGRDDGASPRGSSDQNPTTALRQSFWGAFKGMGWEALKNTLNLATGYGFDLLREEFGWFDDELKLDTRYLVQSAAQLATALPKGAYDGAYSGTPGTPDGGFPGDRANVPLELAHQAARNNIRDLWLEENEEEFLRTEDIDAELKVLDALLDEKTLAKYEEQRGDMSPDERKNLDRFLVEVERKRDELQAERDRLND